MGHFIDHAANCSIVFFLNSLVDFAQAERFYRIALILRAADDTAGRVIFNFAMSVPSLT